MKLFNAVLSRKVQLVSYLLGLYLAVFVASTCITHDDYATLSESTLHGFWGPANGVWTSLGGNISSVIPRTIALSLWVGSTQPIGLIIYSALTLFLILVSFDWLLRYLIPGYQNFSRNKRVFLLLVLSLGFEGVFTPGQAGVLGFSAAAGVHVWPVCLIIIGHRLFARGTKLALLGSLATFLYAANSNVPEGMLALFVVLSLFFRRLLSKEPLFRERQIKWYFLISFTTAIGLVIIFLASGFSARTETAGVSFNPKDLILGVIRSFAFFSADIVTHPFLYLAFLLGVMVGKSLKPGVHSFAMKEFALIAGAYFTLLVLGAGAAYPAWHQTFGLYVLLLPLAFTLGIRICNSNLKLSKSVPLLLIPVLLLSTLITVRSGYLVVARKINWQASFEHNVCVTRGEIEAPLRGLEITYPPVDLGIEDINTWPWMADGFEKWILGSDVSCNLIPSN